MTGEVLEVQKESFWKEHQDTLVRLRNDLVSGRSKFNPVTNVRNVSLSVAARDKCSRHPPYGKYRRSPSPYLAKLNDVPNQDHILSSPKWFDVVPPVKPKLAFLKPVEDFDSWGEESDDDADDYADDSNERVDEEIPQRARNHSLAHHKHNKPQHYRNNVPTRLLPPASHNSAVPVYYPPPPNGKKKSQQNKTKKRPYKKLLHQGHPKQWHKPSSHQDSHVISRDKKGRADVQKTSMSPSQLRKPTTAVVIPSAPESEDQEEGDKSTKAALWYWRQHPLFASDFTDWFIQDCLHTELCPDFMVDTFKEIQHMPYDHPLYLPSLNCCEDIVGDHVTEMIMDLVRETVTEVAYDYMDEKMLQCDPVEDFLTSLMEDVVTMDIREVVRSIVVELAEEYLQTQYSTGIIHMLVDDFVAELGPELLEDALFDLAAEEFLSSEVIAPEVLEESVMIAHETVQYYDTKVMTRELKEVRQITENKLADVVLMELILSVVSHSGNMGTEEDHLSKYLDGVIFIESVSQIVSVNKERDRTLYCKPLHKLHEKVVSDVALDVFLQQLTWSLDEDLADVDEYERAVPEEVVCPLS